MKIVKIVAGLIVVAFITIVGFSLFLPKTATVERSVIINADVQRVFQQLNDLQQQSSWSPWVMRDRDMQVQYSGPQEGVGASMSWHSDVPEVGSGEQTIVESEPNKLVQSDIEFGDQGRGRNRFELTPVDQGVEVNWSYTAQFGSNPVARYFGLALDDMLGPHFVEGLTELKEQMETTAAIITEEVSYSVNDTPMTGYIAYPQNANNAPGVLVVHEWWGHNAYVRQRAEMLAELGYVAFAVDMYGDGKVADHPKEANAFMMEVINNADVAQARFEQALQILTDHAATDAEKTAAIGYCFGGAVVLSMARAGMDLDGVVSFHGSLGGLAPINEGEVEAEFLVLNGAADPMVSAEQKQAFQQEMQRADLEFEFVDYPDAQHAFTNPAATAKGEQYGLPLAYDAEADADSWNKMRDFLQRVF